MFGTLIEMTAHRKRVRHSNEPGHIHELTFSCYRRRPLLTQTKWCALLSQAIDAALQRHDTDLLAFVYMPEHVHLLVFPQRPAESGVAELLFAIKRPVSYRIKMAMTASEDRLLSELTIRERPGKQSFRFWQEGPGYDRNLFADDSVLAAADYIHRNPVRRGLCDHPADWLWSSYRVYQGPDGPPDPRLPKVDRFSS